MENLRKNSTPVWLQTFEIERKNIIENRKTRRIRNNREKYYNKFTGH